MGFVATQYLLVAACATLVAATETTDIDRAAAPQTQLLELTPENFQASVAEHDNVLVEL
jgi:hypothetical protein